MGCRILVFYPEPEAFADNVTNNLSVGMFEIIVYSNMTSFFRFTNKRVIYRLGIVSLAHAPVHVTDFPVVNIPVDELSSARIGQHKLCVKLFASVNKITVFQSKYSTVFVLLDISESK
jgi:uncharacterized membrane-anchored protein YitT (DUF2179 family)